MRLYLSCKGICQIEILIEEGYFKYGNFEFENGNFEKQSGELKANLTIPFPSPAGGTHPLP